MKKSINFLFCLLAATVFSFYSCSDDIEHEEKPEIDNNEDNKDDGEDDGYKVYPVQLQLVYPAETGVKPAENVMVTLKNSVNGTIFEDATDAAGLAEFKVPEGLYEASATDKRVVGPKVLLFNGLNSKVEVNANTGKVELALEASMGGSIVIKELYVGGCPKDDGSKSFIEDQYVVLYNNSTEVIDVSDFAFGMVLPFNSSAKGNKDFQNGKLVYADKKVIPAGVAVWYFNGEIKLEGGKEVVVSMNGAINHTTTYSQSVDLSNSEYYAFYDKKNFTHKKYQVSSTIDPSHYLTCFKYGMGTAWPLSIVSPAFYIFRPEGTDLKAFVDDPATTDNYGGNAKMPRKMVPESWIVDAIEVFKEGEEGVKRLLPSVDAGYINFINGKGYTLYRNVDKEATEAVEGNKDKLVYNYALGVEDSTDPSGIDAEASLKNGARIIYMDTNNSTKDFHQRSKASLRK